MSAVVCGKRSNIFEESPSSPPVSKRIRRYSSSSPGRNFSPPRATAVSNLSSPLDHLVDIFPDMDRQCYDSILSRAENLSPETPLLVRHLARTTSYYQFLEKALKESGDDLDSAIKRLNKLQLSAGASTSNITDEADAQFSFQGLVANNGGTAPRDEPPVRNSLPVDGAEWVDLLVREMVSASTIDDAKTRVSRALEALEKSICANANTEAAQSIQKENVILKQQLEAFIHENTILKRAVSIQHERQKEFDERGQELHQLKQLVSQYQEQMRTLEVNNYALAMHLKQAQQNNSISGRFNPDVF